MQYERSTKADIILIALAMLVGTLGLAGMVFGQDQDVQAIAAHERAARDAVDALRAQHYAAGETELHRAALLWHRQLEGAVTARELYLLLRDRHAAPPPTPEAPEQPAGGDAGEHPGHESPAAGAPLWTMPAGAVVRYVKPGEYLNIRQGGTAEAPLVITSPPGERVTIRGLKIWTYEQHVHVVGLDVNAAGGEIGITLIGSDIRDVWIHDVAVRGANVGLVVQHYDRDGAEPLHNITITDCIIRDNRPTGTGHSQGVYATGVRGLTIARCIFDANGWDPADASTATIFNHNLYVGGWDILIEDNIISRGASFGVKVRGDNPGDGRRLTVRRNLFIECANGLTVAHGNAAATHQDGAVIGNVFTRLGRHLTSGDQSMGIDGHGWLRFDVHGNLFLDKPNRWGGHHAIRVRPDLPAEDVTVAGNRTAGWNGQSWLLHEAVEAEGNTIAPSAAATIDDWAAAHGLTDWPTARAALLAGEAEHDVAAINAWLMERN